MHINKIISLLLAFQIYCLTIVQANPLTEYQEARSVYLESAACMAAYDNRYGEMAFSALQQAGWQIHYFHMEHPSSDAKFIFMKKIDPISNSPIFLLAVAGTETGKDINTDLRFGQVYFGGNTVKTFSEKAEEKNIDKTFPKVHKGFHEVVQTAFSADTLEGPGKESFTDYLLKHPDQKLILTGHSLGGAAATLIGARLISMGVHPDQIKVVTFASPAVGNDPFARQFENTLDLTRFVMSGDQVTSILQDLVGGYRQFGKVVHWQAPEHIVMHPHSMTVYLDIAAKNYYQERQQAVQAGVIHLPMQALETDGPKVYVAPIKNSLPRPLAPNFPPMAEGLRDAYRTTFSQYIFANSEEDLQTSFKNASAAGCQWLISSDLQGHSVKNKQDVYYLTLAQMVYTVPDGRIVDGQSIGSNTKEMTPLIAMLHNIKTIGNQHLDRLIDPEKQY